MTQSASKTPPRAAIAVLIALATWILGAMALSAQPPAGYYNTVDATNSTTLRLTLHDVIDDHTRFPYTDSTTDTWDIVNLADEDPNNVNNIIDIYKNASYTKIPGGVGAYNREHSWPKSYGFPNDALDNYPYTDTHHLFACDASYNSSRSNKPFRDCNAGCSEQTTDFNDGRGGGSGVYPGNSNWTTGSFTQGTWEAWNGRKGDVARAMFYMDLRYEGGNHGGTGAAEPDLILTDNESLIDSGNTGSNESVAYMGMLSVLLQWHADDPPDSREIWRNEVVFSFQGNRNPFIDHPEWAQCLFNDVCTTDTTPPAAPASLMAAAGNGVVDLSWLANGESDLAGYNVYRSTSSGGPYTKVNGALVGTNAYSDFSVVNGTTYFYVVTAVDTSSNESTDSDEASATPDSGIPDTTPPAAPTGLGASGGDGQVSLTWNANGESDLDGYNVYRGTASGGPYTQLNGVSVTSPSYLDTGVTNGTTYFYVVTAVDTSSNESADSAEASATPAAPGAGGVILSEVLYDVSSGDDGFEWIELFNAGSGIVDLSGWCLGNGGTDYLYSTVQLNGTIASGATFVVGGPSSSATNANPSFDQVFNPNPDFQNSGSTGDGVALFDVPCNQVNGSTVPVDAVIYGPNNNNNLIDETGSANAPEVGDASPGSSLERVDLAGNWQIQSSPTPNSTPLPPPSSDDPPSVTISAPADGSSSVEGSSISFAGSATDPEDGDLTANLSWSSNLDGAIGSGGSFSTVLSVGIHTITASVTDSGGLQGSDQITVTINANTAPGVTISAPADGATFGAGTSISFAGSASDNEDGDLTGGLSWVSNLDGAIGSGGSFTTVLSVGVHTITASVTDSGGLQGSDQITVTVDAVAPVSGDLLLSEVLYDVASTDDGLEWVEIYNNDTVAIDLSGFSLGNGGTDYTYSLVQLSGTIQPGETFVVGGPTSSAANGNPVLGLAVNFNPDFQNGGSAGDGVALFNVPASAVTASTVPIDAVIYGPNNNNGLIDETGSANAPEVGDASPDSSLERIDFAGIWQIQSTPTPNSTPLTAECFVDADCSDGLFCNGTEICNAGVCEAGTAPTCDDGLFCNGTETCNETTDSCEAGTAPTCDDGLFCNGTETCNETTDSCDAGTAPTCDDGLFCNGTETCNETSDSCDAGTAPCSGGETCNETVDICEDPGTNPTLWMSFRNNTAVPGVGTVADEDIVSYDEVTGTWALEFDGSDVGLGGLEISALAVLPGGDLLLSFTAAGTVGGLSVDDSDIVRFTPTSLGATTAGSFSLYFDGSDVALTSNSEDIDGLALAADGRLIVSTTGGFSGSGASGADEDLFLFTGTLGSSTSGTFVRHFDGSDVGLGGNGAADVDAATLTAAGNLLLSTVGNVTVGGLSVSDEDAVEFAGTFGTSTSGSFSMRQDLTALGIDASEDIGSLQIVE